MSRALDAVGLALVGVMAAAFMGLLAPHVGAGLSPVFWACAAGALAIIMIRKRRGPGGGAGPGSAPG